MEIRRDELVPEGEDVPTAAELKLIEALRGVQFGQVIVIIHCGVPVAFRRIEQKQPLV